MQSYVGGLRLAIHGWTKVAFTATFARALHLDKSDSNGHLCPMPVTHAYDQIHELALEQHGMFTTEQAEELGVPRYTVAKMARRGRVRRHAHGLYQDLGAPETRWTPYMAAVLWPQGARGVLSHETALSLMELSDVNPSQIHVTVPLAHRVRRREPLPGVVLHGADLPDEEVISIEGLPVTRAARAIRDCAQASIGPALLAQALRDGESKGYLTVKEARELRRELKRKGFIAKG